MANERAEKIIPILERAVKGKPDYTEARIRLGLARLDARDYVGRHFHADGDSGSCSGSRRGCVLRPGLTRASKPATSRRHARMLMTASKWAKADSETTMADRLRKLLDARSQPAAAVHLGEKLQRIAGYYPRNRLCAGRQSASDHSRDQRREQSRQF